MVPTCHLLNVRTIAIILRILGTQEPLPGEDLEEGILAVAEDSLLASGRFVAAPAGNLGEGILAVAEDSLLVAGRFAAVPAGNLEGSLAAVDTAVGLAEVEHRILDCAGPAKVAGVDLERDTAGTLAEVARHIPERIGPEAAAALEQDVAAVLAETPRQGEQATLKAVHLAQTP
ncbi:hypothetical protein PHYSODRAFT_345124 [Phytophthora sojae]|uniref:Uncharacterized protein n=1 Tax=Phytophthora sojae (strain P6497) TaxID=1094619 RepID=G4YZS1_PHYSP|nr:hypothetical protein PHYSODRAFT_345124 [Phytophthora sojae]EGZ26296.1 hypothetical protein PHYSODRAFT_345124 [Phytophthora sojae]|eukprot:XP_009521584.1 hypothetical protein PHYSODRAFT_345124 [Phytophthora sojae]